MECTNGRFDLYFAYGSNMNALQMARRCGDSVQIGVGLIRGWRFRIMERGYATIVPQAGGEVWGGLWAVSARDERMLDRYEGVASGLYRRARIEVVTSSGPVDALVYIATDTGHGRPNLGYMDTVIAGAMDFSLPSSYIADLQEVE